MVSVISALGMNELTLHFTKGDINDINAIQGINRSSLSFCFHVSFLVGWLVDWVVGSFLLYWFLSWSLVWFLLEEFSSEFLLSLIQTKWQGCGTHRSNKAAECFLSCFAFPAQCVLNAVFINIWNDVLKSCGFLVPLC